ncbi:hypothetical protein BH20ACT17_BH20ACT17_08530 [soil metagenome]|jgi:hypothetical protein
MTVVGVIGVSALYLLYGWLASAIVASYLSGKKGYGERVGLATGLLLSAVAIVIWLAVPARPSSDWQRRKERRRDGG